ncbi:MAG: metallophosphoesterase [Planctomycetes bacterium]|nr:metallophosphoesterase [Planctomycetota bacterium]
MQSTSLPFVCVALCASVSAQTATPHAGASVARPTEIPLRWAVIGDYGRDNQQEADIAALVKSWAPEFVVTTGDNNYPAGSAATIDANISEHYREFIFPYVGSYGPGASENRFWPCMGNHDWDGSSGQPYFDYFTLPGNERYYDVRLGPVHFFAVDSDAREPDSTTWSSTQAAWLQNGLAASNAPWKVVYSHHPAYSSAQHGSTPALQWPFLAWGANFVLNGHDHDYERSEVGGLPYFVLGACGAPLYSFSTPVAGSKLRFNADFGALLVETNARSTRFEFDSRGGALVETFVLPRLNVPLPRQTLLSAGSTWKFSDTGVFPGATWMLPGFDDSAWASGPAQLGYGDEATVVSYGANPNAKHLTTWFRTTFQATNPASFGALDLALQRDDAAVVYLNGAEVARANLPSGTISPSTPATAAIPTGDENKFFAGAIDPSALVEGSNVIAIELHQASVASDDLSFDLRLAAQ